MQATGHFLKIDLDIASRKNLTPADKLILGYIKYRIGGNGECWPGAQTISKDLGISRATVLRGIERLTLSGYILVTRGGNGQVNHYSLASHNQSQTDTGCKMIPVSKCDSNQSQNDTRPVSKCNRNQSQNDTLKERTKKRLKEKNKVVLPEIPESLNTPKFQETWATWVQFRATEQKAKVPVTPTAAKMMFKNFLAWGVDRAIAAMETSMASGWRGVFEPKTNTSNSPPPTAADAIAQHNWDRLHG